MVPGPSCATILNTIGTCSTVHRMPYPRRCSATAVQGGGGYPLLRCSALLIHHCPAPTSIPQPRQSEALQAQLRAFRRREGEGARPGRGGAWTGVPSVPCPAPLAPAPARPVRHEGGGHEGLEAATGDWKRSWGRNRAVEERLEGG